jgi:hypothetical protein
MKKLLSILSAILMGACVFSPAYAITITYDSVLDSDGVLTTKQGYATVWDFNNNNLANRPAMFASIVVDTAAIVSNSLSGKYAAPFVVGPNSPDATPYLTVPEMNDLDHSGYIRVGLSTTANYLGLFWGSIDSYNTIFFSYQGNQVASFTGSAVSIAADGNQTAPGTNTYVNFFDLPVFDSFTLSSAQFAFEVDNIAVGTSPVPEPATMLLLGTGLVGLAGFGRKKFKK